MKVYLVYRTF